jgi:NDP-sugar pyrophosphorylase family protein
MPLPIRSALLLTAGLGTRLSPLTAVRAKPAVPVAGEPLVRRIARWLIAQGVADLVLNLHHLPETITAVVGDGSDLGGRVRYSWEQPIVLGTAGGPRQALALLGHDPFFIVNGDMLADVDLGALAARHVSSNALVTLALAPNPRPSQYGGLRVDAEGRVIGVVPRGPAAGDALHFLGVQVACADAFASIEPGRPRSSIGGVYDDIIATRPGAIAGFISDAGFEDIGTVTDYWRTSFSGAERAGGQGWLGRGLSVGAGCRITRSIVWDDVRVGPGATLDECIVTDRVDVPANSAFRRQVLHVDAGGRLAATPFEVDQA